MDGDELFDVIKGIFSVVFGNHFLYIVLYAIVKYFICLLLLNVTITLLMILYLRKF